MTSKRHSPGESVARWSRFHLCSLNSLGSSPSEKSDDVDDDDYYYDDDKRTEQNAG